MTRVSSVVVITEGFEDSAFARGFLTEAGLSRAVQLRENPRGKGSGYGFVFRQFVFEVKNLLRFREGHGVIGLVDGDGETVEARVQRFEAQLTAAGLPGISASEGRCVIVPIRNLESWTYWLRAQQEGRSPAVSEAEDYKKHPPQGEPPLIKRDFGAAGRFLHGFQLHRMPQNSLPALCQALGYLREFVQSVRR